MLIIEILKIIASLSITLALFYTFYKVGRQSAYDDLLKHFEDAVKTIGKQDATIKPTYRSLRKQRRRYSNERRFNNSSCRQRHHNKI